MKVSLSEFCLIKIANQIDASVSVLEQAKELPEHTFYSYVRFAHFQMMLITIDFSISLLEISDEQNTVTTALKRFFEQGQNYLSYAAVTGKIEFENLMIDVHEYALKHAPVYGDIH
ncbi:hypothetical protein VR7878_03964 [Vibrio ruber DSM 16370]|uniref:Uncharacterized protein n=1 Tax=Vibrio ruber (strain DSM 16370 / JCM 11486 / BCRC 17186 / CECT 7878 / LMG 23124 / VR1) TaxID=1123498 RepID=A0A1R4LU01_VIBR1|nr:hypothetical protein [Vibrio ruber]SJN60060.1 hypothetical protein VR7878_03964 [Vibrio ruber DSM 16370]